MWEVLWLIYAAVCVNGVGSGGCMMHGSCGRIRLRFQWQRWQCLIRCSCIVDSRCIICVLLAQRIGKFVAIRWCWMQIGECFVAVCNWRGGRFTWRHTAWRRHCVVIIHAWIGAVRRYQIGEWIGLLCVAMQQELIVERRLAAGRCRQWARRWTICEMGTTSGRF